MKILAIRGCNLASLAGEFEIDLSRGPLGAAGVFAIVGNTGAGKSTLLDALCVALFDRTPRLTNHSTVKVGRGADEKSLLGAQDVRTLLRRGAAQGWAEVDFESRDARQYRARWSVRRARGQSDGNLQDEQLSLTAIEGGERFGGTKTETLKAIHARLGLSFDQFRRSALLAQGEFAAFLRADGKDRSELLERMTGTQIYSRLSIAAHVKAAIAEQRLKEGRTAALAIVVLDDDAERAMRGALEVAKLDAEGARRRHAAALEAARWLEESSRRERALAEAIAEHQASRGQVLAAEADRAELALRRRAEKLRPAWDEALRLEREVGAAAADAAAADAAVAQASTRLAEIATRRAELLEAHAPVREARIAAGIVERARGVHADEDVRGAAGDAAWLAERAALAPEIAAWPELEQRFAQHGALVEALGALERAIAEQAETQRKLEREHKVVASDVRAATRKHDDAKRKAASFAQKRGLTLDAARRLEDEARTRVTELDRLVALAAKARELVASRAQLETQLGELGQVAQRDVDRRAALDEAQRRALAVRGEQLIGVEALRRAAGYEHARTELVDGEPCPLCGAAEHPWRDRGALDDVIAAAEARLRATQGELDAIATELAGLAAREAHRRGERERIAQLRAQLQRSAEETGAAWRAELSALGELLLAVDPATAEAEALAADRQAVARRKLEEARTTRSQTEAATKAAQDAQGEVAVCQSVVDQLGLKLAELERRRADSATAIGRARGERTSKLEQHADLVAELRAAMLHWSDALPGEPELAAVVPEAPRATRRRTRAADAAEGAEPVEAPAIVDIEATFAIALVSQLQASAPGRQAGELVPASPLAIVRLAMANVVAAWRACAERVAHADAVLAAGVAAVERTAREIDRTVAEHTARRGDAQRRRSELGNALATAQVELDAARADAGFAVDELRRLLSADPSRVDALAERLAALERAVDRTRAVVNERERLVADHVAKRPLPPRETIEAAEAASGDDGDARPVDPFAQLVADAGNLDSLAAAVSDADRRTAQLAAALDANGEAKQRRASALADLEASELDAEVDRVLGEVIGSHDGKLFRSFAQSLTLDSLLAVANAHLEELAPRYQLERVPRHDLELQVIDRDLGSEVRSVQSLSGGESFLVSLALALGLSSMSAHDVRVRTLLIDEGFGTLDPSTLDAALSVLDALQATGRQVGVISHVPALVERVGAHVRVVQRGGGRSEVIVA